MCARRTYMHTLYIHFCLYCKKKIPNKICWISLKWLSFPHTVDIRHVYIFDHGSFYYTSTFPIHNIFILYRLHLLWNGFWWDAVAIAVAAAACVVAIAVLAILSISSPFSAEYILLLLAWRIHLAALAVDCESKARARIYFILFLSLYIYDLTTYNIPDEWWCSLLMHM